MTPQNSPAPARKQTPVLKPTTTKDEPDVCSLGFGKEVQIHVMKCKPGMEALCYVYFYLFFQIKTEKKNIFSDGKVDDRVHVRNSKLVKGADPSQRLSQRQQPEHR